MPQIPLQLIDNFLMDYTVGHVLFLVFVLAAIGGFAVNRSTKLLGLQLSMFGLLFVLAPSTIIPATIVYFGLALLVAGPIVMVVAEE